MRFALSSLVLIAVTFVLFVVYAAMSFVLWAITDELTPFADDLSAYSKDMFLSELSAINLAFGVAFVFLFAITIIVFVVDNLRQEPESFVRYRNE